MTTPKRKAAPMTTKEAIQKIHHTHSQREAMTIALIACETWMGEHDVVATGNDNGYSTVAIYSMPDGGKIRLDGRGWTAE